MRNQIALWTTVAAFLLVGSAFADECCEDCGCTEYRVFGSVDYLFLKARRSGLDFAIADPNTDNNIEGPVQALELESASGFRSSIGYLTSDGWTVGFTYMHFGAEDQSIVAEPAGGRLWLTRSNPASFNNDADAANARAQLGLDVFDLEAGYWFYPCCATSVRLFGGVRGAVMEHDFLVDYTGGSVTGTRSQEHRVEMDGAGLRFGAEGHWHVRPCVSLFGRTAASVLVGDFSETYTEMEPIATGNVDITYKYFDIVPVLDLAAGLEWERGPLAIQLGYEISTWLNVDKKVNFTGAETINRGQFTDVNNSLGLEGWFARAIFTY